MRRAVYALLSTLVVATPGGAQSPPQSESARDSAAIDITGYWVSVVSEDWKFRMVMPNAGEYGGLPLNTMARQIADRWAPSANAASSCRNFGAAAIMRVPGRLEIDWASENTLRIRTDAGQQTRELEFAEADSAATRLSLQGYSKAVWQPAAWRGSGSAAGGSLKVVTDRMLPGNLRPNGVPYSSATVLTEYVNLHDAPNGDQWLVVSSIIEDPEFLRRPYVSSVNFKRLPGRSGWNPSSCQQD
jgi:hypothetical protein